MATYAIGDIQGCYDTLCELLDYVGFDARTDRLWLVGDLVNRGPKSLEVLRWARDLGDRVVCVLGNHDIHLLRRCAGAARRKKRDTLDAILEARDRDELLDWLRSRPIAHVEGRHVLVHAGLHPAWSIDRAIAEASDLTTWLRADDWQTHMNRLGGKKPLSWTSELAPEQRRQAAAAVFFSIRTCRADGSLCAEFKGPAREAPSDCTPWFRVPEAHWLSHRVLFGHWATLGLFQGKHVLGLDSGCVWGGALTACRLEDGQLFQVPAREPPAPH